MKRTGLVAAAALIVVANAIALVGVARNRASTLQTIDLTEREVPLAYRLEENSGIDFRLDTNYAWRDAYAWRGPYSRDPSGLGSLDAAKLQELGFPTAALSPDKFRYRPARPAYVAFEYDGADWQALSAQENRIGTFGAGYVERQSHLVAVDASRFSDALLAKYGNTGKHLIVRATVRPVIVTREGKNSVEGRITEIIDQEIHVPLPAALGLEKLTPSYLGSSHIPRYTVRLAYGTHFEPWVISVTALPK